MINITPVILAAGDSMRMGYPKALLPFGAETFLTHILATLKELDLDVARVVLGTHEPQIRPLLHSHQVRILVNPNPARGQFSSMRLALEGLDSNCRGCLLWPVDQPLISLELIRGLLRLFGQTSAPLVLPVCSGKTGHPAIFGRELIDELLAAPPDANPKLIIAKFKTKAARLPCDEIGTIEDIDSPDDYLRLTGASLAIAPARQQGQREIKRLDRHSSGSG
jgi:molybdenum cofactor cytidylyltransferase